MPLSFFTNSGGSGGGSAVPFQRLVEPQQLGLFLNLEQAELLRIQRYSESWRFYFGKHWSFTREDGEPLVTLNYYRKFLDKLSEFMVGKGFVITTHEALEETAKAYVDEVWKYNGREELAWDIATTGGVTGDVFCLITDEEPTPIQQRINPFSQGRTRINLLSSEQVFPTWDPMNTDVLTSVRIETIYHADRNELKSDTNQEGRQLHIRRFTQIITPNQIMEQYQGQPPVIKPNPLGEIPIVHIKNLSVPKEYYGLSDGQDLTDINRELNEKSTDISDTINYHSAPITVITGAKAKNLQRGPRQIWSGLPSNAAVFNLKLEGDLQAAHSYWDKLKRTLHELGDVPEGILGQTQPISNTSGVALHIQYQPIIGRTKRKRVQYEPGFERINYFILRIGMLTGRINLPFDICNHCGGRILELAVPGETVPVWSDEADTYIDVPRRVKKCFEIDRQTLEFKDPQEMHVKIWREYGFGGEIRSVPVRDAAAIAAGARSYWDYAYVNADEHETYQRELQRVRDENHRLATTEALEAQRKKESGEEPAEAAAPTPPRPDQGQTPPRPPKPAGATPPPKPPSGALPEPAMPIPKVQRLPMGEVSVPEEPLMVAVSVPLLHPRTGAVVRQSSQERLLVPTGCRRPAYLNPLDTCVSFNDVLPKDEALQSNLYASYQDKGWVDEEWVQRRIPEVAGDIEGIKRRLKAKATTGMPQPLGSAMTEQTPAVTDLTPAEQPQDSVPGPGGNPVPPGKGAGQ